MDSIHGPRVVVHEPCVPAGTVCALCACAHPCMATYGPHIHISTCTCLGRMHASGFAGVHGRLGLRVFITRVWSLDLYILYGGGMPTGQDKVGTLSTMKSSKGNYWTLVFAAIDFSVDPYCSQEPALWKSCHSCADHFPCHLKDIELKDCFPP